MTRPVTKVRPVIALIACALILLMGIPRSQASFPGDDGLLVFSFDGDLFLVKADGRGLRPLTSGPATDESPSWSADGQRIAFVREGVIQTMWADGRGIRSTGVRGQSPRWYPDRTRIAFWSRDGVWTMRPNGRGRRLILESQYAPFFAHTFRYPSWSVEGYLAASFSEFELEGTFIDIIVESPPPSADCDFDPARAEWSPDGRMLAVTGFGDAICLTDGITGPRELDDVFASDVAWSPEGGRLALDSGSIVDLDGDLLQALPFAMQEVDWQPRCTVAGTPGDDVLTGTVGKDVVCGLGGDDQLFGLDGSDVLLGGSGDDYLDGGPGDDLAYGGFEVDRLFGRAGDDFVSGGPGMDLRCNGGSGEDRAEGCEVTARIP